MKTILLTLMVTVCESAIAGDWHLLTKSQVGEVSIQHGLTLKACEFARKRLLGLPATKAEEAQHRKRQEDYARDHPCPQSSNPLALHSCSGMTTMNYVQPSDIVHAECFK